MSRFKINDTDKFLAFKRRFRGQPHERAAAWVFVACREPKSNPRQYAFFMNYLVATRERVYTHETFMRIAERVLRGEGPAKTQFTNNNKPLRGAA
jgi:hypothetical protein